jgi:hypothetical protein
MAEQKKKYKKDYISWSSAFDLIEIDWFHPFKTYRKVRKAFRPLAWRFYFGRSSMCSLPPFNRKNCARILGIYGFDVGWKDKYDTPRYEHPACVHIILFRWFSIGLLLKYPKNAELSLIDEDEYWEQALWYAEYSDCDIDKAIDTWPYIVYDHRHPDGREVHTWIYSFLREDVLLEYLKTHETVKD